MDDRERLPHKMLNATVKYSIKGNIKGAFKKFTCKTYFVTHQHSLLQLKCTLSLSHSRSGGRVTAPIRSRKSQRRRGSVLNCPPGQMSLETEMHLVQHFFKAWTPLSNCCSLSFVMQITSSLSANLPPFTNYNHSPVISCEIL